jgi:hypothetical protein
MGSPKPWSKGWVIDMARVGGPIRLFARNQVGQVFNLTRRQVDTFVFDIVMIRFGWDWLTGRPSELHRAFTSLVSQAVVD